MKKITHPDARIIAKLGGPQEVARLLKLKGKRADATVENWKRRGIPATVRLAHVDLFGLPKQRRRA